jgi:hypothetical protein
MPVYVVDSDIAYVADANKAEQAIETTCGQASALSDARAMKRAVRDDADDDQPVEGDDMDDEVRLGDSKADANKMMGIATVRVFAIDIEGLPEMDNGTQVRVRAIGVLGSAEMTGATNGSRPDKAGWIAVRRCRAPASSAWASWISRSATVPVDWISRSARVDLPWSIWATMEKLRISESWVMRGI